MFMLEYPPGSKGLIAGNEGTARRQLCFAERAALAMAGARDLREDRCHATRPLGGRLRLKLSPARRVQALPHRRNV